MANIKKYDWVEPAHPVIVKQYDDIIDIYKFLKNSFQARIDTIFDSISKNIGFVVTTTMPVIFHIGGDGKIEKVEFGTKALEGTIFEREFKGLFNELSGKQQVGKVSAGDYSIYLIWHEALKLKLKADWIEPAHFRKFRNRFDVFEEVGSRVRPEVREPAHWFDAGISLATEEEILIAAIDEVYTDLKLAERVSVARRETLKLPPGVREPAHFRDIFDKFADIQSARRLVPGVREPAHFRIEEILKREDAMQFLTDLSSVFHKYGL